MSDAVSVTCTAAKTPVMCQTLAVGNSSQACMSHVSQGSASDLVVLSVGLLFVVISVQHLPS